MNPTTCEDISTLQPVGSDSRENTTDPILLKKRSEADAVTRFIESVGNTTNPITGFALAENRWKEHHDYDPTKGINLEDQAITNGITVAIDAALVGGFYAVKDSLPQSWLDRLLTRFPKLNPWYRRFKNGGVLGSYIGQFFARFVPFFKHIPFATSILQVILGAVFGLVFGIAAVIFFSDNPKDMENTFFKVGQKEGWSKYVKTGVVYGGNIGMVIGGTIGLILGGPPGLVLGLLLGGLAGNVLGGLVAAVGVPLINKLGNHVLTKFTHFRTNYMRAGITLGSGVGLIIGLVIGTLLFPGVGTVALGAIGTFAGAIGAVVGGLIVGAVGPAISRWLDFDNKATNSWDYSTRTGSMIGTYGLAFVLKFLLPNTLGKILGAAATVLFGIIGGIREVYYSYRNKTNPEVSEHRLPWSQRMASGAVFFGAFFSAIGGIVEKITNIKGITNLFLGIGGLIGSAIAVLLDPATWRSVKDFFKFGKKAPAPTSEVTSEVTTDSEKSYPGTMTGRNLSFITKELAQQEQGAAQEQGASLSPSPELSPKKEENADSPSLQNSSTLYQPKGVSELTPDDTNDAGIENAAGCPGLN